MCGFDCCLKPVFYEVLFFMQGSIADFGVDAWSKKSVPILPGTSRKKIIAQKMCVSPPRFPVFMRTFPFPIFTTDRHARSQTAS
jgi:hypothetical protein